MPFSTQDPNVRDDWLTVGSAKRLLGSSTAQSITARLLGNTLQLWRDAEGRPCCSVDGKELPVQERYGYLWVHTGTGTPPPLFDLPEYREPGRRIVDCGGIGVATSGLRVVENFLDIGHFPYVHTGGSTLPGSAAAGHAVAATAPWRPQHTLSNHSGRRFPRPRKSGD